MDARNTANAIAILMAGQRQSLRNAKKWLRLAVIAAHDGKPRMAWRLVKQACMELRATPWKCQGQASEGK